MATVPIRDILDNETGEPIFPRTHVKAVIGLADSNFFEEYVDGNGARSVKLRSDYVGLWAEGWISNGGIGANGGGGGGGLINGVYGESSLGSIYSPAGTEDLTKTFSAFAIDKVWQSVLALQQSTPNVSLTNGQEYSSISINGASAQFYTKSQVDAMIGGFNPSLYLPKAGGTMTGHLIMNNCDIIPDEGATVNLGYGNRRFNGLNVNTISTSFFSFRNANWEEIAHFSGGADYLAVYLATSTEYYFFGNTSFQGRGVAKNLGESYVRWGKLWCSDGDLSGALNVGTTATIASHINVGGVVNVNSVSSIDQSHNDMALFNYGARTTKSFNAYGLSANLRAIDANGTQVNTLAVVSGSILCGSSLRPDYNLASANLGSAANDGGRWANIYAVNANLTGDITLGTTSHIDIGPVRIEYHSSTDSLHITTNDATNHPDIGFWVDGFNSAGGYGSNGGGGGGLITGVYGVSDLGSVYSTGGTEDSTKTFSAFAIDKVWQAVVALQQSTPNVSLVNGSNYSTITVNGSSVAFYTKSQIDAGIHSFEYVTASSLPTAGVDTMYKIYLVPAADQQTLNVKDEYITIRSGSAGNYSYSWEQIGSTSVDLSDYVTTTALGNWTGSTKITTLGTITTGTWSGTAIGVTKGGTGLTAISKGAILYASAANTISALSANGESTKKFLSQTSNNAPSWGTISLSDISGTSDLQAIEDLSGTSGFLKKTASNTWTLDTTSYLASGTTLDSIDDGNTRKLANYLPLAGGTMTGDIVMSSSDIIPSADLGSQLGYSNRRFSDINARTISVKEINFKNSSNNAKTGYLSFGDGWMNLRAGSNIDSSYKQINLHETYGLYPEYGSSVNLGYYSSTDNRYRWANIYGVNADLTGDVNLASSSEIKIGNARIVWDSGNNSLRVTKISGTSGMVGLYVDGPLSSGGAVGQSNIPDELNYDGRLYIQHNSNDLCLTTGGHTIIGGYDPSIIGSNKFVVRGSAVATAWNTSSDARLKEDISVVGRDEAVATIMKLNPVSWTWNERSELKGKRSAGLIAQQVESVIPYMVTGGEYKGLNYTMLHAFEIGAIQSHEDRIKILEGRVKSLNEEIERLRASLKNKLWTSKPIAKSL